MKDSGNRDVPGFVHWVNVVGLAALTVIIVLSAVVQPYQLIVLVPILGLGLLYWRWRANPTVAGCYLGLSLAVGLWILICENIVTIDNLFKTQITSELPLRLGLLVQATDHLTTTTVPRLRQTCCNDLMSFHLKAGSTHQETYDCETCNEPYSVVVDETGYLNVRRGLYESSSSIELFITGDSLMQGIGMPSVVEALRDRVPVKMWNLLISSYGPRQKVDALLTYALPKRPRWLIVEFNSANDPMDALEDEVCRSTKDFRCTMSSAEIRHRLLQHPTYRKFVAAPDYAFASFERYAETIWTVAVSRYVVDAGKGAMKGLLQGGVASQPEADVGGKTLGAKDVSHPSVANVALRSGSLLEWSRAGMELGHQDYERLARKLRDLEDKPRVILLYTPSAYEVYRGILFERHREFDEVATFQLDTLRAFAMDHGWTFTDLTEPIRERVSRNKIWIYGRYDRNHWSQSGTRIVADALAEQLLSLIPK